MKRSARATYRRALAFAPAALLAVASCSPPPPPPPAQPTTATAVDNSGVTVFTATVVHAAASSLWTYTLTAATTKITSIEVIGVKLSKCTLTAPTVPSTTGGAASVWKITYFNDNGTQVPTGFSDPVGLGTVTFSITCDVAEGPIYLIITDGAATVTSVVNTAGASIVGPIAGPT